MQIKVKIIMLLDFLIFLLTILIIYIFIFHIWFSL